MLNKLKPLAVVTLALIGATMGRSQKSVNYSTKPFTVPRENQNIPAGYPGNSIRSIFDARFNQFKNFKGQGEYETKTQYSERIISFAKKPILGSIYASSTLAFAMTDVSFRYDADAHVLFVRVGCTAYAYKNPNEGTSSEIDLDNVALTLSKSISKTKKIGKTRMGISFPYFEEIGTDYSILLPSSTDIAADKNIVIGLEMSPEDARKFRTTLRVLFVGTLDSIRAVMERDDASLDSPYETAIIHKYIRLDDYQFLVFDAKTGRVLPNAIDPFGNTKHTSGALTPEAADEEIQECKDRPSDETLEQCKTRLHGSIPSNQ